MSGWRNYFDERFFVGNDVGDRFCVYTAGCPSRTILLCIHGAGHTSMSWALTTLKLKKAFFVVAYDCRGHGATECVDSTDFSQQLLVADGLFIIQEIRKLVSAKRAELSAQGLWHPPSCEDLSVRKRILLNARTDGPPLVLVGHSMGGAMAIHLAASSQVPNLQGLIVLDVVEGLALEALPTMQKFVEAIPTQFASIPEAVAWSLTKLLRNRRSAELSIPSQLRWDEERQAYVWVVDLAQTARYWHSWFEGISEKFLDCRVGSGGKLLVLVGHDSLDKVLTIGHMQGKYQLQIVRKSGHVIEEDQPDDVVSCVMHLGQRYFLVPDDISVDVARKDALLNPSVSSVHIPMAPT